MKRHFLMAALLLTYIYGVNPAAWGQETEQTGTLEVIGRGRIYRDNVANAREEAVADGLRNAVEQGVGLLISSPSVVNNFQLLSDRVYSQAEEFIHDYKVLTESRSGRYYRLVVQATMFMSALQDKLQDMGILMVQKGMPSVLLLLSEQNIGQVLPRYSWEQSLLSGLPLTTEHTLSRHMREKGFVIVNQATLLTPGMDLGPEYWGSKLSDEAAVKLAEQLDAEVVIVGNGLARFSGNVSGAGMKSIEAELSLRAIRTEDGMVIGSSDGSRTAVHANEIAAGTEALTLAASDVTEDLSRQIAAKWGKETSQSILVDLVVKGIKEYADFVRFRTTLRNEIRGVENVYLRAIKAGEAKMDVDIKGNTCMLADQLMLKSFEGFGVNIFEVGQSNLVLELIPKQDVPEEWQRPMEHWDLSPGMRSEAYRAY